MITADLKRLGLQPKQRLLDIGCGSGRHTSEAYRLQGVVAVGADLNIADLKQARERLEFHDRLGEHGGGCWCLSTADVRRLPFPDAHFHAVICSEVMEHIPEHHRAADELVRVLKPGGHLVVSVPRYFPERICWALSREYHQANQGHVRIYRKKALIRMIEHTGLTLYRVHYAHSLHAPYWWLKCLVGPTRNDSTAVNLYHRFLTWDILHHPRLTRQLDRLLNPILGKSLVLYFQKPR
ncbi:MAG: class I SAM-dependent methyltransferase [Deltaproteobacteria bacterium]|jgi:SAM-dependent methyltransferase|nr:class I SAM-dependent methyltransferase [Deltaproteobacteria bacterium]